MNFKTQARHLISCVLCGGALPPCFHDGRVFFDAEAFAVEPPHFAAVARAVVADGDVVAVFREDAGHTARPEAFRADVLRAVAVQVEQLGVIGGNRSAVGVPYTGGALLEAQRPGGVAQGRPFDQDVGGGRIGEVRGGGPQAHPPQPDRGDADQWGLLAHDLEHERSPRGDAVGAHRHVAPVVVVPRGEGGEERGRFCGFGGADHPPQRIGGRGRRRAQDRGCRRVVGAPSADRVRGRIVGGTLYGAAGARGAVNTLCEETER